MDSLLAFNQWETLSNFLFKLDTKLSMSFPVANMLVSYAVKALGKSLTYIRNNKGPRIDPWGTPYLQA